jgi:hypothetical protein
MDRLSFRSERRHLVREPRRQQRRKDAEERRDKEWEDAMRKHAARKAWL